MQKLQRLGEFSPGFLHDRKIGISILPESEEILVDGGRFRAIAGSRQSSGQLKTCHGSDRIIEHDARMIKNLLKLSRCLAMLAQPGVSQATHVDRIHCSKEGSYVKGCAGNSEVVRSGYLGHLERFRCVALVDRFECPQSRQIAELNRGVLRVALFKVDHDLMRLRGLMQNRQRKSRSVVGIAASVQHHRRSRVSLSLFLKSEECAPYRTGAFKLCGALPQTCLAR